MRHRKSRLRLPQKPGHARMFQRNLVTSLLLYESIRTTKKRALVIRPAVERLITTARTKPPHVAIRAINRVVTDKNASRKIMQVFVDRYKNRPSGIVRIVPVGLRKGDGAALVDLTLVDAVVGAVAMEKKQTIQRTQKSSSADRSAKRNSSESSASSKK